MLDPLNRLAARGARALLAWIARQADPARQPWLEALGAEIGEIDDGFAQLGWALGGLHVLWLDRRHTVATTAYQSSPDVLLVVSVALLLAMAWSNVAHQRQLRIDRELPRPLDDRPCPGAD